MTATPSSSSVQMIDASTIRIERLLPGPIERVWEYLTHPEYREQWLAGGSLDPRTGGEMVLEFDHDRISDVPGPTPERFAGSVGYVSTCRIQAWDPPHELSFSWPEPGQKDSFVHIRLDETSEPEGQVQLVLTHSRLGTHELLQGVAGGWHTHLDILADRIDGRNTGNFWNRYETQEAHYLEALVSSDRANTG